MGKLSLLFTTILLSAFSLSAELLTKDFKEFAEIYEQTLKNSKIRNYDKSVSDLEAWLKKNPDSSLKSKAETLLKRLTNTVDVFDRLKKCSAQTLIDTELKIGKSKASVTDFKNGTLSLKLSLSGSATKKETVTLEKLPALSIYYLLIKAEPEKNLQDTATLLLADQNYKLAKSILLKMKKGGQSIDFHTQWFKDWYAFPQFSATYKKCLAVDELMKAGSFGEAKSTITTIQKSIAKNEAVSALFSEMLSTAASSIDKAEEKAREKELAAFINYPLKPGDHKKVTCAEFPQYKYDVYLPPQYDHKGKTLLPILYTFSPGGNGMVRHFKKAAGEMGIILIGNLESKNGVNDDKIVGSFHAMMKDIRQRIHYDPNFQMTAGMSGGGWSAYYFARRYASQISGVLAMGAWLGQQYDEDVYWQQDGLIVARTHGNNDGGAKAWVGRDAAYLKKFKAVIQDWEFPGGHVAAPYEIQKQALEWMLKNIKKEPAKAQQEAASFKQKSLSYVSSGNVNKALEECVKVLITSPRTWKADAAQRVMDKVLNSSSDKFKTAFKRVGDLPGKNKLLDYFGLKVLGAGQAGDKNIAYNYYTCLKNLKGGFKRWDISSMWALVCNNSKNLHNPDEVIDYLDSKKSLNINEEICLGAAYVRKGEMDKANELLKKVEKQVKNKVAHHKTKYEEFKNMVK